MAAITDRLTVLREVWLNRDLRNAELAWGGFHAAEWGSLVAVSVVAHEAHGTGAVGLVLFARMLACGLVTPFVAVLGDRIPRERILLAMHLIRAVSFTGTAVALAVGGSVFVVYAFAVAAAVPLAGHRPCHLALGPLLAQTPAQLTAANVAALTLESAAALGGPAIAALLLAVSGPSAVFVTCAAFSVLSAVAIAQVHPSVPGNVRLGSRRIRDELREGAHGIVGNPRVRLVVGLFGAQAFVRGCLGVFLVVIALDLVDLGDPGVGLLSAAFGLGGLAGAVASMALVGRGGLGRPFQVSLALWGLPLALVGLVPEAWFALVALAVAGLANTVLDVAGFTSLQERADQALLGRIFGLFELVVIASIALGSLLAPVAVSALGDRGALILVGGLLPALALLFHRPLTRLDAGVEAHPVEIDLLRGNPIFAPLPYVMLRGLARSLGTATFAPGETIVHEGDPGDEMYVIADGQVRVTKDGRVVNELSRGDAFGEIALLLEVPRTATATATTDARVYVLDRETFIGTVTQHQVSGAAVRALVDARLERSTAAAADAAAAAEPA